MSDILLINPPVAKPSEPPAGIARIAGTLNNNGFSSLLLDASLEAILFLLNNSPQADDTWSRRAARNCEENIAAIHTSEMYRNHDRYRRTVSDLNRLLEIAGREKSIFLSLSNYQDPALSPLKSSDLLKAATDPQANIFYQYFSTRLSDVISTNPPRIIGFSLNYLSQTLTTFAMVGFLKSNFPSIPIVLGGGLVTSWLSSHQWDNPFTAFVDHLVPGPGERPLLELLGGNTDSPCHPPDYTSLPFRDYFSPVAILPYAASSGCYWNKCSFCPEKAEDNPYLALDNPRVRFELDQLTKTYKPELIHFLDNAISPSLLRDLADNPPGVNWYGFCRCETIMTDPGFCHSLKKSGCVMVKLGLESGDQDVLNKLDKGINLQTVSTVLKNLAAAGIATYIYLLFGTPAEDITAARRTLQFIVDHAEAVNFLNLAIFNMPVNSPEARSFATNTSYEGDLSLYTEFDHPDGWNRKEVRNFLDREFKRHPVIAEILRNDPPIFTSNHAPFFCKGYSFL